MAHVLNDRVKETSTTTGTGTINLAGANDTFETFVSGVGTTNTTYYCIKHQTSNEFEVGIGTVTDASPDTLSRTTIISSSNSDNAVDFSAGTKEVFCTLPASKAVVIDNSSTVPISNSDIVLTNTNTANTAGTDYNKLEFKREPSDNSLSTSDNLGEIKFTGDNASGANKIYAHIRANAIATTASDEDGGLEIRTVKDGSEDAGGLHYIRSDYIKWNAFSRDIDFRVQSTGSTQMFHIDAGNDGIGIKTLGTADDELTVNGSAKIDFLSKTLDDVNDSTVGTSKEVNLRGVANPIVTRRMSSAYRSQVIAGNPIGYYQGNQGYSNNDMRGRLHYVGDETGDGTGTTYDAVLFYGASTNSSAHTIKIAIYTRNKYGYPSKRVHLATSTNPMASSTGSKVITGDFTLKSGWYFVMVNTIVASGTLVLRSNYSSSSGHSYGRYSLGVTYSSGTQYFPTSAGDNSSVIGFNSSFTDPPLDLAVSGTNYAWFATGIGQMIALRYKNIYSEDLTDA